MHSSRKFLRELSSSSLSHQRNKAPNEQAIPLLMPQHHMVIPHYMGQSREIETEGKNNDDHRGIKREDSSSSLSQDIPLLLPQDSDDTDTPEGDVDELNSFPDHLDQPKRVRSGHPFSFRKAKIEPVGPDMPMKGFVDSATYHGKMPVDRVTHVGMHNSDPEWWETQERGDQGSFVDESGQVGPRASCRCQVCCSRTALL